MSTVARKRLLQEQLSQADIEHISTTQMLAVHICNEKTIYTKLLRLELPNHPCVGTKI
jgi:hypothetical protein